MAESLEVLKSARKKVKQKCDDKCKQVEEVADLLKDISFDNEEDIVQWLQVTKNDIKIKDHSEE